MCVLSCWEGRRKEKEHLCMGREVGTGRSAALERTIFRQEQLGGWGGGGWEGRAG